MAISLFFIAFSASSHETDPVDFSPQASGAAIGEYGY